jgi:hypothetical protein
MVPWRMHVVPSLTESVKMTLAGCKLKFGEASFFLPTMLPSCIIEMLLQKDQHPTRLEPAHGTGQSLEKLLQLPVIR